MVEQEKQMYAFCCSNDLERTIRSFSSNCHFFMTTPNGKGLSMKKKQSEYYPRIPSATCSVPHGEDSSVPDAPE